MEHEAPSNSKKDFTMATKFGMVRDINGYNGFGLLPTDTAYSATLATTTDTTLTVPSVTAMGGCNTQNQPLWLAIFAYDPGTSVWVAVNHTAGVPAGASFAATNSELNPSALLVYGKSDSVSADVIHFYTAGTGVNVGVRFYSLS